MIEIEVFDATITHAQGASVSFYRPGEDNATDEVVAQVFGPVEESTVAESRVVGPPAGMVATRIADLIDTGHGRGGGGALVPVEGSRLVKGETAVFCQPAGGHASQPGTVRVGGHGR